MPRDGLEEWKARDPIIELRKQTIPPFYVTVTVDMTDAFKQREELNSKAAKDNKISMNDMVVKAAALALGEFPQVNCKIDGDNIVYLEDINIAYFPHSINGYAITRNETFDAVKVVADTEYRIIYGVHIVGPHATEWTVRRC
jgi:pyruvate/2-oxoglutarate dehydrogenase complex dihydrolipoamide dehydrogenase (E3) component